MTYVCSAVIRSPGPGLVVDSVRAGWCPDIYF